MNDDGEYELALKTLGEFRDARGRETAGPARCDTLDALLGYLTKEDLLKPLAEDLTLEKCKPENGGHDLMQPGDTAMHLVARGGYTDMARLLLGQSQGDWRKPYLHNEAHWGLLRANLNGRDPKQVEESERVEAGRALVMELLSAVNDKGDTPFAVACKASKDLMIRVLLQAGNMQLMETPDAAGMTPLMHAVNGQVTEREFEKMTLEKVTLEFIRHKRISLLQDYREATLAKVIPHDDLA